MDPRVCVESNGFIADCDCGLARFCCWKAKSSARVAAEPDDAPGDVAHSCSPSLVKARSVSGASTAKISGSPGFTGLPGTSCVIVLPGSGSKDQSEVPAGKTVPGNTLMVMAAVSPLNVAVTVALPCLSAVSCGGSEER